MVDEEDFPDDVAEILKLMREGPLLTSKHRILEERILDIHLAMEMQQDQDIKKPYRYIVDITEDASGEIDSPPFDERRQKFRELRDKFNYFEAIRNYFSTHAISRMLSPQEIINLSEAMYEDLMLCAESRLLNTPPHPYFEKMLDVYKRQGFPCAWRGGSSWKRGRFVVYAVE